MTAPRTPSVTRDVVPARITQALDVRAMYGPGVDEACGVREPAVDRWESGDERPSPRQVERLAFLTGFPVAFFYRDVEEQAAPQVIACQRSGKGRGCAVVTPAPPVRAPKPGAPVTPDAAEVLRVHT